MKTKIILFILLGLSGFTYSQRVGIGTTKPDASASLDISSSTGGLLIPRMTTAERNAIYEPAVGLMIYNTETNCIEVHKGNTVWYNYCWGNSEQSDVSSNGTAVIEGFDCNTGSTGTLTIGNAVSDVSQTLTAVVKTIGTYDITAVVNGVKFTAKKQFLQTGNQEIELIASGTPTVKGKNYFSLNTVPNCRFEREVTE